MPATTVLRWFHSESDPPIVQTLIVEPEEELALRNQQRLEQAKRELGGRYVLHSSNKVTRQNVNQPRKLAARALAADKLRNSEPEGSHEHHSREHASAAGRVANSRST